MKYHLVPCNPILSTWSCPCKNPLPPLSSRTDQVAVDHTNSGLNKAAQQALDNFFEQVQWGKGPQGGEATKVYLACMRLS